MSRRLAWPVALVAAALFACRYSVDPDGEKFHCSSDSDCGSGWHCFSSCKSAAFSAYCVQDSACDACPDLTSDPHNCGSCGTVCSASETCVDSVCVCLDCVGDGGSDGGVVSDAGPDAGAGEDGGAVDAGTDAGEDAGIADAGVEDGGTADASVDAGGEDAGADAGAEDAGPSDAGVDAGFVDAGPADAGVDDGGVSDASVDAG